MKVNIEYLVENSEMRKCLVENMKSSRTKYEGTPEISNLGKYRELEYAYIYEKLSTYKGSILDIGSEFSFIVPYLQLKGKNITASELNLGERALKVLKLYGIKYQMIDATKIPCQNSSFGCVMACSTVEHIIEDEKAFEEILRVAKDKVILTFPYSYTKYCPHNGHQRIYNKEYLIENYLKPNNIEYKFPEAKEAFYEKPGTHNVMNCIIGLEIIL